VAQKTWTVEWLVVTEQGKRRIPAFEFLTKIDHDVATHLLQILDSVCVSGGPHKWRDVRTHDKMDDELDDLHEARYKLDQTLYRLYLKWITGTATVWVLDGRTKPNNTKLPDVEYEKIRALAALTDKKPAPAATVDDFARLALEQR
jgi:hypothetical protein